MERYCRYTGQSTTNDYTCAKVLAYSISLQIDMLNGNISFVNLLGITD